MNIQLFEAKAKCFEGFGENYQVFQGISGQIDDMEARIYKSKIKILESLFDDFE